MITISFPYELLDSPGVLYLHHQSSKQKGLFIGCITVEGEKDRGEGGRVPMQPFGVGKYKQLAPILEILYPVPG